MPCLNLIIIVSTGLLGQLVMSQTIPTQQEQANLLLNVDEVFQGVQTTFKEEVEVTNKSVVKDIDLLIARATYTLQLLEQITLMSLSCNHNSVCMLDSNAEIKKLAEEGRQALQICARQSNLDMEARYGRIVNVTDTAVGMGRSFLDSLGNCSKKIGLGLISCYRGVIKSDVQPVKNTLLGAIQEHKVAHLEVVDIRDAANTCIDDTVKTYRNHLEQTLANVTNCI